MQDKYTIGPVTIVQLVGLNAKPRIASAQADAAVRAADPSPPSAAAGLGDGLSEQVVEIASSSLNLKAAPALGLSADPVRGGMSFDSGVDRPVVDASASAPAADPSAFEQFLPQPGAPNPPIKGRDTPVPSAPDNPADASIEDATLPALPPSMPDDGAQAFGDNDILDVAIPMDSASFAHRETAADPMMADDGFHAAFSLSGFSEGDRFSVVGHDDVQGEIFAREGGHSASDGIPPI